MNGGFLAQHRAEINIWSANVEVDAVLSSYSEGLNAVAVLSSDGIPFVQFALDKHPRKVEGPGAGATISLDAPSAYWSKLLRGNPDIGAHAYGASLSTNAGLKVQGPANLLSAARASLERLFELASNRVPSKENAWPGNPADIVGKFADVTASDGERARIFYEVAGDPAAKQSPIVFLHTAGADSRQFHFQLLNRDITSSRQVFAFDLPRHGRSLPLFQKSPFIRSKLTGEQYVGWCVAFIEQVVRRPVVLVGCSMGSMAALMVGAQRPDIVSAVIAVEAPDRSPERRSSELSNPAIDQMRFVPTYVRGLMSPQSPEEHRDLATWTYSQGGFGTYEADVNFYSSDFDGKKLVQSYEKSHLPIRLLTGSYDYSASPASSRRLAEILPNSTFTEMKELGHFPMTENPACFDRYLLDALKGL